jgi:hypothetical protein
MRDRASSLSSRLLLLRASRKSDVAVSVPSTVSETDALDFSGEFFSFSCEGGGWLALDPVTAALLHHQASERERERKLFRSKQAMASVNCAMMA